MSGQSYLAFKGTVITRAVNGTTGTLLLDPRDITISTGANANPSAPAGPTFTGTAAGTVLNVTTLTKALAGNNVTVDSAGGTGAVGNGFINVDTPVTYSSSKSLTF